MILDTYNLLHIITSLTNATGEMHDGHLWYIYCHKCTERDVAIMKIIAQEFDMRLRLGSNAFMTWPNGVSDWSVQTKLYIIPEGFIVTEYTVEERKKFNMNFNDAYNIGRHVDDITGVWTREMYDEMMQGYEVLSEELGIYKTKNKFLINPNTTMLACAVSRRQYMNDIQMLCTI